MVREPWFRDILKGTCKCVKTPEDALTRDFFMGVRILNEQKTGTIKIHGPVLTESQATERLKDPEFCRKCLYHNGHDFYCEDNIGWKSILPPSK